MRYIVIAALLLVTLIIAYPASSFADWVNLTGAENSPNIAEFYIEEDHVKIKLEVYVEDLTVFKELIPDEMFSEPIPGRPDAATRLHYFAENTLQLITGSGEKLPANLDLAEPRMRVNRPTLFGGKINPYTGRPVPGPPKDKRVLYIELSYPFKQQPTSITIIPPVDEKGLPRASIGFICYHQGVPVVDFRNLTPKNVLQLDWDDPWYSAFTKKQLRRSLQSGMRAFLYIEPYEVRHEILVRVKDMMSWIDFDIRGSEFIEEDEFNAVREKITDFFMNRENVIIDGERHKPILDRSAYVESSMLRSRFIEIPERVPLNTAMVGVVITYLTDGIPGEVMTEWDLFSDRVQSVTGGMTDPAGPFPYTLTPDDNVLHWKNHLKKYTIPTVNRIAVDDSHRGFHVPLFSLICLAVLLGLSVLAYRRKADSKPYTIYLVLIAIAVLAGIALRSEERL